MRPCHSRPTHGRHERLEKNEALPPAHRYSFTPTFLSCAHCAGLKRALLKHRCTTLHLSVGSVNFSLFLPSPNGRGKNLFSSSSPTSRTVTFFAGYHRNILSISLFYEEGETRAKGRNECLFVRSSFPPLPTPPPS